MTIGMITSADDLHQEQLAEESWSMQAAADRDQAIAVVKQARRQLRVVRAEIEPFDRRLAFKLAAYQAALDERLGALLVAREDAGR